MLCMPITLTELQQKVKFRECLISFSVSQQFIEMPPIPNNCFLATELYIF